MPRQPGTGDRTRRAVIRHMYNVQTYTDEKIADILSCSVQTVRRHVANKLCDDLAEDEHYLKEWKRARNAKVHDALADRPRPSTSKPASARSSRALSRRKLVSTKGAASTADHDLESRWTSIMNKLIPHAPLKFQSSPSGPNAGSIVPTQREVRGGQGDKQGNQSAAATIPPIAPVAQVVPPRPRHLLSFDVDTFPPSSRRLESYTAYSAPVPSGGSLSARAGGLDQQREPILEAVHPDVIQYVEGLGLPAEPYARKLASIGLKNGILLNAARKLVSDRDLDRLEEELRRSAGLDLAECLVLMAGLRRRPSS